MLNPSLISLVSWNNYKGRLIAKPIHFQFQNFSFASLSLPSAFSFFFDISFTNIVCNLFWIMYIPLQQNRQVLFHSCPHRNDNDVTIRHHRRNVNAICTYLIDHSTDRIINQHSIDDRLIESIDFARISKLSRFDYRPFDMQFGRLCR